jgi:hypothetical protein
MNPQLLILVGQLLQVLGPIFAQEVAALETAGSATATDLATLKAQIETMDTQRMASWATADAALTTAAGK